STSSPWQGRKTWMPGTGPGMTAERHCTRRTKRREGILSCVKSDAADAMRQSSHARRHCAVRIVQRINDRKMVCAGDFLIAGECPALPPGFGNRVALPQEFARLQGADNRIEAATGGNRPIKRRY